QNDTARRIRHFLRPLWLRLCFAAATAERHYSAAIAHSQPAILQSQRSRSGTADKFAGTGCVSEQSGPADSLHHASRGDRGAAGGQVCESVRYIPQFPRGSPVLYELCPAARSPNDLADHLRVHLRRNLQTESAHHEQPHTNGSEAFFVGLLHSELR